MQTLFAAEGSDAWFGVPEGETHRPYISQRERLDRLVPSQVSCPHCERRDDLSFHEHVVDVWFESGVSHSAVLGDAAGLPWLAIYQALKMRGFRRKSRGLAEAVARVRRI